jgi:hypothetical protein
MKKLRTPSPALIISVTALILAVGGGSYAVASNWAPTKQSIRDLIAHSTADNANHLQGLGASHFVRAKHFTSSGGVKFLSAGQTVMLGKSGHFTFSSTCSKDSKGQNQATFDVVADTTADLDGGGVVKAGTSVNIHTNSTTLDTTPAKMLNNGDFDQVASASSSTEIAADGQEVDVFYTDGVNWPAGNGSQAHDCFAGYTGFQG